MATSTYIALANYTVTGSAKADVTFSSIPATYRDLVLVAGSIDPTNSGRTMFVQLNGDNSSTYVWVNAAGYSTSSKSSATGSTTQGMLLGPVNVGLPTDNPSTIIFNLMDYSATDKHKTGLARHNSTNEVEMIASRWPSTNAVTSMRIYMSVGDIDLNTTFALYGIVS